MYHEPQISIFKWEKKLSIWKKIFLLAKVEKLIPRLRHGNKNLVQNFSPFSQRKGLKTIQACSTQKVFHIWWQVEKFLIEIAKFNPEGYSTRILSGTIGMSQGNNSINCLLIYKKDVPYNKL